MARAFKNNTIQADAGDNTNKIKIKTQYNYVKNAVANSDFLSVCTDAAFSNP